MEATKRLLMKAPLRFAIAATLVVSGLPAHPASGPAVIAVPSITTTQHGPLLPRLPFRASRSYDRPTLVIVPVGAKQDPCKQEVLALRHSQAKNRIRALGRCLNAQVYGNSHWQSLDYLATHESHWNPKIRKGQQRGPCGIPQANPCSKLKKNDRTIKGQIKWMLRYIKNRRDYRNPRRAWQLWQQRHPHWY